MESEAANRGCRIDYERRVDLPPVLADYLEIQLVLVNLLQNALKAVGSADVYDKRISVEAETREEDKVMVSVGDRGPGVRPDRVADIFEPLYSGASGMGMGLAICRAIIEAHGGQIWHEPDPAGGAIFRFTLRIAGS
jgi:two-component system sensor kinase FixL